jgi:glycosyltransferase involved in cell wall biosynthesis
VNASARRVVHLVPPNGGGVDRLVRDLCSRRRTDWLLHLTDDQCVIECAAENLLVPVAARELDRLLAEHVLGRPALLHAHSTVPAVRRATQLLAQRLRLAYIVTLHDVEFAGGPDGGAANERAERLAFLRAAAHCTVPSRFMQRVVAAALGDSFECIVLENGVDALATRALTRPAGDYPIAVIGAMGPHKGLSHLVEVAEALPPSLRIVLLGYADGQLEPGWLSPGRIRVHGVFEPAQLPVLVAEYGAAIAFFPAGQPESYCYALSDAWLAGLPVVGPDCGAIGERVRAHDGGSLYEPTATADEVVLAIERQLARVTAGNVDLAGAIASLSSIDTMVDQLDVLYEETGAAETTPDLDALRKFATNHLDSRFFRKELLRLQGDLGAAQTQRDNALAELATLAGNFAKRGEWIEQLERGQRETLQAVAKLDWDCQELRAGAAALGLQNAELQAQLAQLRSLEAQHAALQESMLALQTTHDSLKRVVSWPLLLLPASWRPWVASTAKRLFLSGDRNG